LILGSQAFTPLAPADRKNIDPDQCCQPGTNFVQDIIRYPADRAKATRGSVEGSHLIRENGTTDRETIG
jgi:hypothetical protein